MTNLHHYPVSATHSAIAQKKLRKKPAVARAGDKRTIETKKVRDTEDEPWPWVISTWARTPLRDCGHG